MEVMSEPSPIEQPEVGNELPGMLSLSFASEAVLAQSYMRFIREGGLFFPTPLDYPIEHEVFIAVSLPGIEAPVTVHGKVVWKTPAGAMFGRPQGIGIQLRGEEGRDLRQWIESLLEGVPAPDHYLF